LQFGAEIRIDGMGDVFIFPGPRLPAGHSDKNSALSLDDLDIVYDKAIIKCNGHIRLQFTFSGYFTNPDISYFHGASPLAARPTKY
jgi:hypothetical protein